MISGSINLVLSTKAVPSSSSLRSVSRYRCLRTTNKSSSCLRSVARYQSHMPKGYRTPVYRAYSHNGTSAYRVSVSQNFKNASKKVFYLLLSGTFSKATVALNAERFNSSCFSNSCLTEFAFTFCCMVARSGSMREFRSVKRCQDMKVLQKDNVKVKFLVPSECLRVNQFLFRFFASVEKILLTVAK